MQAVQIAVNNTTLDKDGNSRAFSSENLPTWTISIENEVYVKIVANSGSSLASQKYWVPFVKDKKDFKTSIWHSSFGFQENQVLRSPLILQASNRYRNTLNTLPEDKRSIISTHSYSENRSGLILGSDELANNTFATHKRHGAFTIASQVNFLQHVNINVNRYSFIHFEKTNDLIGWHDLNGRDISSFDIWIHDSFGNTFDEYDFVPEFQLVLCFEQYDTHDSDQEKMIRAYNREAYRLEHYNR
jgi:hypothetical protein